MTKHACTLCGSRDWPSTTTDCPLCREEPENMPPANPDDDYEPEYDP